MSAPYRSLPHTKPRCHRRPSIAGGFTFLLLVLLCGTALVWPWPGQAQDARAYGVAVTPRNFPDFTIEDVDAAFTLGKRIADYAVFIYQWGELDIQVPRLMVEKSRAAGLRPIIGLSPTTLGEGRKELDLPDEVRAGARPHISFASLHSVA